MSNKNTDAPFPVAAAVLYLILCGKYIICCTALFEVPFCQKYCLLILSRRISFASQFEMNHSATNLVFLRFMVVWGT